MAAAPINKQSGWVFSIVMVVAAAAAGGLLASRWLARRGHRVGHWIVELRYLAGVCAGVALAEGLLPPKGVPLEAKAMFAAGVGAGCAGANAQRKST